MTTVTHERPEGITDAEIEADAIAYRNAVDLLHMETPYRPLPYDLFVKLPELIQTEMIDEVISGFEFVRGGTFYTPETFRRDLEINRNNQFCFHYRITTTEFHGLRVLFTFGHYYNDSYGPEHLENWEGFVVQ